MFTSRWYGIWAFSLVLFALNAHANSVRNGGDSIHCSPAPNAPLAGDFVLDYVATYDLSSRNSDVHFTGETASDILSELQMRLRKVPILGEDFAQFVHDYTVFVYEGGSPAVRNMWVKSELGLIDLDDQDLIEPLPANCYDDPAARKAKLHQAIVQERRSGVNGIIYHYDPKVLATLEQAPLQISFLLVHEWLWRFAQDASVVRAANRLLHSDKIEKMSGNEILYALNNLGIQISHASGGTSSAEVFPITLEQTARREPHGRAQLSLSAEWYVVPEKATRVRFVNHSADPLELRRLDTAATICKIPAPSAQEPSPGCELGVSSDLSFPVDLFFEREPLVEPLYDSKRFTLLH